MALDKKFGSAQRKKKYDAQIEQLLAQHGVWQEKNEGSTRYYRACCPVHGGDNPSAFRISSWGDWRCYRCHAYGKTIEDLLVQWRKLSFEQATKLLGDVPDAFFAIGEELPPWKHRKNKDYLKPKEAEFTESDIQGFKKWCPRVLINRGFSASDLKTYEIGYNQEKGWVVLPFRDHSKKLVGVTYREDWPGSLTFKFKPVKYRHDGFDKAQYLYGLYHYVGKPIEYLFLAEGQLDAIRLVSLGYPAVAIMGSSLSRAQVDLLVKRTNARHIVLCFDNDDAGRDCTKQAGSALLRTHLAPNLLVARYAPGDPGELTSRDKIELVPWLETIKLTNKERKTNGRIATRNAGSEGSETAQRGKGGDVQAVHQGQRPVRWSLLRRLRQRGGPRRQ